MLVNSKVKFGKSVPYNVTQAVQCVLEEFCDAAARRLDIKIDSHSLDIEPGERPGTSDHVCSFQARMGTNEIHFVLSLQRMKRTPASFSPATSFPNAL